MLKRSRHASFDTPASPEVQSSPAKKRARIQSSPIRPRTSLSFSTPSSQYALRTPVSVPQDSPTNPFGLKRSLIALDLPPQTPFRKHISLRFQIVDEEKRVGRDLRGGVYRVVQVPLSYSFRLLHKLILYIFATDLDINRISPAEAVTKSKDLGTGNSRATRTRAFSTVASSSTKGKGKERAVAGPSKSAPRGKWGGHWFETLKSVTLERESVKPGAIGPKAKTWIKSSSIRDRRLFKDVFDPLGLSSDDSPNPLDEDEPESGAWRWEAEDDLTLGTVWPERPDLERGIIYHHTPTVSVHITVNTLPVERRKGWGNEPHVFLTQGSPKALIQIAHVITDERGREGTATADDTYEISRTPDPDTQIQRWNEPQAFENFLKAEADRERASRRRISLSPSPSSASLPQLLYDDRSSSISPELLLSSDDPVLAQSEFESELEIEEDLSRYSDGVIFPFANSAITPYPTNPLRRRRVECVERRISRLTARGLREVMSDDEDDARRRAREKEKRKERAKEKAKEKAEQEEKAREAKRKAVFARCVLKTRPMPMAKAGPGAKTRALRFYRELENEDELERDEEGNVRDLLGIYEAEV